jgi:hypothetical protein
MFPISSVKSIKPLSTLIMLNITSTLLLVGSRILPKVLPNNEFITML